MTLLSLISTPRLAAAYYFLERADRFGLLAGLRVDIAFEIFRRKRLATITAEAREHGVWQ